MKTILPQSINTINEAKSFLTALCSNNEAYHPDDNAHDIGIYDPATNHFIMLFNPAECDQLNKLMADIFNLEGNDNIHKMAFDPYEWILYSDLDHVSNLCDTDNYFIHVLSGNKITILENTNDIVTLSIGNEIYTKTVAEIAELMRLGQYDLHV